VEAAHACYTLTCAVTALAFSTLCALLETRTGARFAFYKRGDVNFFLNTPRGVQEGDVGLCFDIISNKDFLLERVASSACTSATAASSTSECTKEILEVYVLETACSLCATEPAEASKAPSLNPPLESKAEAP
jgi:hypothetical protein